VAPLTGWQRSENRRLYNEGEENELLHITETESQMVNLKQKH